MINFQKVSKLYNHSQPALQNIDLAINQKEFVTLVGPSGAGKTTLIKLLIREELPTQGNIYVGKQEIASLAQKQIPYLRRRIGVVFQDFKLLPEKTAYENISFAMEMSGYPSSQIQKDIPRMLSLVGLGNQTHHFPRQLSGGEKQRIALARALIHRPDILIADEPTGNLDPDNTQSIINLLQKINQMGITVILATHDQQILSTLKHRFISIKGGQVVQDGMDYVL